VTVRPKILARSPSWTKLPPDQHANSIYLSGADGRVRSYSQNGELGWKSPATGEADQFLVNDQVVVTSGQDGVNAFSTNDGAVVWSRPGQRDLETLTARAVVTSQRSDVKALDTTTGELIWKTTSHEPVIVWGDSLLTVGGARDRQETLQSRQPDTGQITWSTTDGDIQHVIPNGETLLYSSTKFGRHHQQVQRVSCRDKTGGVTWEYRCTGRLRSAPLPSPDGTRIALSQKSPVDPSTSVLTVLDASTGIALMSTPTAMETKVAFGKDGSVVLAETEFARIPGEEKTWLRCLDSSGDEKWSRPGKPDWMSAGDHVIVADGTRLSRLSSQTGQAVWSQTFSGALSPVTTSEGRLTMLEDGCRLVTVDLSQGEITETMSNGEKIFIAPEGRISDHQGQIWNESVGGSSNFAGQWAEPEPFHIAMKAAPTERNSNQAVFVDWDGDEADDGTDPILLDSQRKVVSWKDLQSRDHDEDQRLETENLEGLNLWFDSDGDGKVSSEAEINPLLYPAFDKGRLELDQSLLWLASDSRCPKS
jgi:outer membrane protein assembly factor BamB